MASISDKSVNLKNLSIYSGNLDSLQNTSYQVSSRGRDGCVLRKKAVSFPLPLAKLRKIWRKHRN